MRRNFVVISISAVLFGLSFGIYDLVLPLWLKRSGINYLQMGWVFAISNATLIVLPVVTGWLADHFGRKWYFGTCLACCSVVYMLTPTTAGVATQTGFRMLQRAATGVYESLQSVLLYESNHELFMRAVRFVRGFEFICHALGALLVWMLIRNRTGQVAIPLFVASGMLGIAFVLVSGWLGEPSVERDRRATRRLDPTGLPPVLILLVLFNFVFMLGLSISHSQMMILFFYDKFDLAEHQVAWISMAHRLSIGLPMVLAVFWVARPNKWLFALTVFLEGLFVSLTVLPSGVVAAVALWLLHDPVGAAIWFPINAWYMQHYARPEHRAGDVAMVMAMSTLGTAFGPIIAGHLAEYDGALPALLSGAIDLPFLFSGVLVAMSAALVCLLPKASKERVARGVTSERQ